jgi:hypothetical protein
MKFVYDDVIKLGVKVKQLIVTYRFLQGFSCFFRNESAALIIASHSGASTFFIYYNRNMDLKASKMSKIHEYLFDKIKVIC